MCADELAFGGDWAPSCERKEEAQGEWRLGFRDSGSSGSRATEIFLLLVSIRSITSVYIIVQLIKP